MATTLPDITVNTTWVNLNTASGIAVGTAMSILNKSPLWVRLIESSTQPTANSTDGVVLTDLDRNYARADIPSGSLAIWAKVTRGFQPALLTVQTV